MSTIRAIPTGPRMVADIELTRPLQAIVPPHAPSSPVYVAARCLVRLAGSPLAVVEIPLRDRPVGPDELADQLWPQIADAVAARFDTLGLPAPSALPVHGLDPVHVADAPHLRPPITVVIASRDRATQLDACLRSVLASAYPVLEIIVVDNAPSDTSTAELVQDRYGHDHRIRYVREDRPGLARAHNAALSYVRTPLVAFTDDDVLVDSRWLDRIVAAFASTDHVACVTGMIFPAELDTPAQLWVERHVGFGKGFERKVFDLTRHRPADPLFPFTAGSLGSGANMAFTTAFLRETGGFDPALGAGTIAKGGDDLAIFHEVIVRSYRLVYEPSAVVFHHHHRAFERLRHQIYGYGVGLGAYLTRAAVERPSLFFTMLRHCIPAVAHARRLNGSDGSPDRTQLAEASRSLAVLGRFGLLAGPWSYARSRWATRGERRELRERVSP